MTRVVIYHSQEWDVLVSHGWVTVSVEWLEPRHIRVALMLKEAVR